jgi:rhodanese-related sulfurtransferase
MQRRGEEPIMSKTITRDELRQKLDGNDPVVVIEALPAKYFEDAHLPSALNGPLDTLEQIAARAIPNKNAEIVTYCASITCKNSDIAAERLEALGYANVRVYREGKADWIAAGLPTEKGPSRARDAA